MSENKNDELELEYLDDEFYMEDKDGNENESQDEYIELFEEIDENEEYMDEDIDDIEDYEEDEDETVEEENKKFNPKINKKIPKEVLINRIMLTMGIVIACFTIFYAFVIMDMFKKDTQPEANPESVLEETTTVPTEETTEEPEDDSVFISPYLDTNITQEVKDIFNDISLDSMESGLSKLDLRAENVISKTVDEEKTIYENTKNIYDYIIHNFEVTSKSYVDDDSIYEACSSVDYISFFDMELIYRANKALNKKSGSSEDLACALTVLFRNYGLEAYYIEGEANVSGEYESRGYTLLVIDDEYYLFDVAYEIENISDEAKLELDYATFCKTFDEVSDIYTEEGIEESIREFEEFDILPQLTFNAEFTADNGGYASGKVKYVKGYSESGNSYDADGNIIIELGEKVFLSGSVSGSYSNTWKLGVKVYDSNMNYVTENVLYNVSTDSTTNSVTYTPSRAGFVKLNYMVTDSYGRTCTISTIIEVEGEEETETSSKEESSEETTTQKESDSIEEEESSQETTSPKYPPYEPTTSNKPKDPTNPNDEDETVEDETTTPNDSTDESENSGEIDNPEETTSSMDSDS